MSLDILIVLIDRANTTFIRILLPSQAIEMLQTETG